MHSIALEAVFLDVAVHHSEKEYKKTLIKEKKLTQVSCRTSSVSPAAQSSSWALPREQEESA